MDRVRFAVEPVPESIHRGFEVQIFVNDVEMTRAGAGLGMDTNDLLIPENRFRPRTAPHRVAVARCGCGVYGCGATDVIITPDDNMVHWDWLLETPMERRVTFDRTEYVAEVERLEADRSWETPERVVVRLIAPACNSEGLVGRGLRFSFAEDHYADPSTFHVAFTLHDRYQVFIHYPWEGRTAEELAADIQTSLRADPELWTAKWHAMTGEVQGIPPSIAGPTWSRFQF